MAETERQKRVTGRVMHEYEHGELKSGVGGKGGAVKSRKQAIAIALSEAGASRSESKGRSARNLRRAKSKESRGETGQQEAEGRSHIGAAYKRESTPQMGGSNARTPTTRKKKAARSRTPSAK